MNLFTTYLMFDISQVKKGGILSLKKKEKRLRNNQLSYKT